MTKRKDYLTKVVGKGACQNKRPRLIEQKKLERRVLIKEVQKVTKIKVIKIIAVRAKALRT